MALILTIFSQPLLAVVQRSGVVSEDALGLEIEKPVLVFREVFSANEAAHEVLLEFDKDSDAGDLEDEGVESAIAVLAGEAVEELEGL